VTLQPLDASSGRWAPPTAHRLLTGQETAREVGLSWERFRKVRETWTRDRDFPAEINEPGEPVRYLADAVARWVERRSRRVHAVATAGDAPEPQQGAQRAAAAGRASLRLLKGSAR
jgi:hypothetical protein